MYVNLFYVKDVFEGVDEMFKMFVLLLWNKSVYV